MFSRGHFSRIPTKFIQVQRLAKRHVRSTFYLIFEEFLCAKLEDVVQFLLGHGASFGAQARPHHQVGQHHLPLGHLRDALLHAGAGHKAVDHHLVGLADAVGSAEGLVGEQREPSASRRTGTECAVAGCRYLNVVVRVPVGVEDDDRVCGGQVDAQASGSSGEQETKLAGARSWETQGESTVQCVRRAQGAWWGKKNQSLAKDLFPLGQTLNKEVNITATQGGVALVRNNVVHDNISKGIVWNCKIKMMQPPVSSFQICFCLFLPKSVQPSHLIAEMISYKCNSGCYCRSARCIILKNKIKNPSCR